MNYEGKLLNILPAETIATWWGDRQKQTIVLEENRDSEYKGGIVVDFRGEKVALLADLKVGDIINVGLNSKAREYNGRWYNAITGWKIEKSGWGDWGPAVPPASSAAPAAAAWIATEKVAAAPAAAPATQEYEDELPF